MNKAWLLFLFLVAAACQQSSDSEGRDKNKMETLKNENGEETYSFSSENAAMNAAIKDANKTYPLFEQNIFAGDAGASHFVIKMIFQHLEDEEHLWLNNLHRKNGWRLHPPGTI